MDTPSQKALLRQRIAERMQNLTAVERRAESRSICRRIQENLPRGAKTICAYVPLPSEADITPLLIDLLQTKEHAIFLPRFVENRLTFHQIQTLDDLIVGALKIKEPPASAPALAPALLDLALIPGRAFDQEGYRLGRGNGGYDVWIRAQRLVNPKTLFWGIALACQIAREVPHEAHDEKVDVVMAARGPRRSLSCLPVRSSQAKEGAEPKGSG